MNIKKLSKEWKDIFQKEFEKEYFSELEKFIEKEYREETIYPPKEYMFSAYELTPFNEVKIVVVGQDPYHAPGQAHGLAFSVEKGIRIPPSLVNIYKELHTDINFEIPNHGYLVQWAKQGVLLMNTCLTVRDGQANSHKGHGWENFTDNIIKELSKREKPMVFILWGNNAKKMKKYIDTEKHLVIEGTHPSPLSAYRGFFGGKYFSRANEFLQEPVDWTITE